MSTFGPHITVDGDMNMLRKRIKDELHAQTAALLQHLLLYMENNAISNTGSKIENRAEQAGIRINCGFASGTPWQQPVECELMLFVRKPLKVEAFHQQQTTSSASFNVATQAENHIFAGGGDFALFNAGQSQQSYWNAMGEPMLPESSRVPDFIPGSYSAPSFTDSDNWGNLNSSSDFHVQHPHIPSIPQPSTGFMRSYSHTFVEVESRSLVPSPEEPMSIARTQESTRTQDTEHSIQSTGQFSDPGSAWAGSTTITQNSGFAYGASNTANRKAPKEGYETRRAPGTVGRLGNRAINVPAGLATAARMAQQSQNNGEHVDHLATVPEGLEMLERDETMEDAESEEESRGRRRRRRRRRR